VATTNSGPIEKEGWGWLARNTWASAAAGVAISSAKTAARRAEWERRTAHW
jgi:hypothetical protein